MNNMSSSTKAYLLTGAIGSNGNIGGEAARALLARAKDAGAKVRVRIGARNLDKARAAYAEYGDAVEVVPFDFGKPETYGPALAGTEAALLGAPEMGGMDTPELLEAFVLAAEAVKPRPPLVTRLSTGSTSHYGLDIRKLCVEHSVVTRTSSRYSKLMESGRSSTKSFIDILEE